MPIDQDIHTNIDMSHNYRLNYYKNDVDVVEIKSCKFFNDFFANKSLKRPETTFDININI